MSTKVSESTGYTENFQMSAFGYIMAALLAILLLPLLPVFVVAWLVWRAVRSDEDVEDSFESWREGAKRPPSGS